MKGLPDSPKGYFDKFSTAPVTIKPFDPRSKEVARVCMQKLREHLAGLSIELLHGGSTRFGIAGEGEIEVRVYPADEDWSKVLKRLEERYGNAGNAEENYARFNSMLDGYEVEIIVMRGYEAEVDRKLTEYLVEHGELLQEYEKLKRRYAYSRREYQIQKDRFFRKVIADIPEE